MLAERDFNSSSTTRMQIPIQLTPVWTAQAWGLLSRIWSHVGDRKMIKFIKLLKNEEGATAIEYGLIAALIAVAAIGAMQGIGNKLNTTYNNVSNHLS